MIGGLQRENGDLNNKYLKKKSKSVGRKYLEALRWISQACKMGYEISQVESLHFAAKGWFRSQRLILAFSLVWLASNGYNFFISAPIHAPFEALDSWLPELQNEM